MISQRTATRVSRANRCVLALAITIALASPIAAHAQENEDHENALEYRPLNVFNQHFYFGSFVRPVALAYDRKHDELWMADNTTNRIAVFRPDGAELFSFTSTSYVSQPARLAVTPEGNVAVIEGAHDRIRLFNYRGDYIQDLKLAEFPEKPVVGALTYGGDGRLYVADNRTAQIFVYDSDGRLRVHFGSHGTDEGQFMSVCGIAIDANGQIIVGDQQALAVQIFDDQGNFVRGWGKHEMGAANFSLPSGIAVDSKGRIFVTDELRHQVKVFDQSGQLLTQFGGLGFGFGQISFPTDVAIDSRDRVYVSERTTARIQVFEAAPSRIAPDVQ